PPKPDPPLTPRPHSLRRRSEDTFLCLLWPASAFRVTMSSAAATAETRSHPLAYISSTAAIKQLHEVGINQDPDILAYEIIKKLPKTLEFTSISTAIAHLGTTITPDLVLNHLRLHTNQLVIETSAQSSSTQNPVSLVTNASKKRNFIPICDQIFQKYQNLKIRPSTVLPHFYLHNPLMFPPMSLIWVLLLT
ncbi:hypothetical protein VP01_7444g1, partial [Puccinia sorghi]